ncbi:hypothetical protein HDIA_0889 [Hartmannibacter diazotrophicus]|uniref:Uncharacterized protein n=1 Tax=Hartmannibacter diazotrophicus TaxID=1482074 RepID=A0A2C9D2E6_9HYPH|nr:hypothetical protein [Hartmannibacter diazotrophicus]SON54430.1 hypothetical protein HDIA_0889 [Hartmannibacter diazotrophicus]
MLFNLETDSGEQIVFYVVPDTFSAVPRVRIVSARRTLLEIDANEIREALVAHARHETGRCGFSIDATMIPGLAKIRDLSIYETETNLLVYRRRPDKCIERKVLNLSASLLPPRSMDNYLKGLFHYSAIQLEAHGTETVSQLFLLNAVNSLYLSGRILYKNYEVYAENGFSTFMCVDDPYVMLAERIIILGMVERNRSADQIIGHRDALMLKQAAEFAEKLPLDDGKALRKAFKALPPEIAIAFVDPVVRLLTATTPTDMARSGAVAWALDELASFKVVGIRRESALYADTIGEYLGIGPIAEPLLAGFPKILALADILREEARVEHLIAKDLELYHHVESAFEKSVSDEMWETQ